MCPNDGERGGLGWSINLDSLPNDYSSANKRRRRRLCCSARVRGYKRDSWRLSARRCGLISRCHAPLRGWYIQGGSTAISSAFYLSFKSLPRVAWWICEGDIWMEILLLNNKSAVAMHAGKRLGGSPPQRPYLSSFSHPHLLLIYKPHERHHNIPWQIWPGPSGAVMLLASVRGMSVESCGLRLPQAGTRQASDLPEGGLALIPIIMWLGVPSLVSRLRR